MPFSHFMGADVTVCPLLATRVTTCNTTMLLKNKLGLVLQVMAIINAKTDILANSKFQLIYRWGSN